MISDTVIIFAAGDRGENLDSEVRSLADEGAFIICADAGYYNASCYGIKPDLMLGDFDSIEAADLSDIIAAGALLIRYPAEKDKSDLEIAIDEALLREPTRIIITTALGGRFDHILFNFLFLFRDELEKVRIEIRSDREVILPVRDYVEINEPPGTTVSLVPLSETVKGVTLEGFKYPLFDEELSMSSSRGLSNETISERSGIEIESGKLLAIINKQ